MVHYSTVMLAENKSLLTLFSTSVLRTLPSSQKTAMLAIWLNLTQFNPREHSVLSAFQHSAVAFRRKESLSSTVIACFFPWTPKIPICSSVSMSNSSQCILQSISLAPKPWCRYYKSIGYLTWQIKIRHNNFKKENFLPKDKHIIRILKPQYPSPIQ